MREDWSGFRALILREYLLNASPQAVYDYLRESAPKDRHEDDEFPKGLLTDLHRRREPLIDLGLAQFSNDKTILRALYDSENRGLRCAVLANPRLQSGVDPNKKRVVDPESLFADAEEERLFFQSQTKEFHEAYLTNRSIHPDTLVALCEKAGPFSSMDDGKWQQLVLVATANPAFGYFETYPVYSSTPAGVPADGFWLYQSSRPARAAWKLLSTAPVDQDWASILVKLIHSTHELEGPTGSIGETPEDRAASSIAFLRSVFGRWSVPDEPRREGLGLSSWNEFGDLRETIASKVSLYNSEVRGFLAENTDLFVRRGTYRTDDRWDPTGLAEALRRDQHEFLDAAVDNDWFYRRECPAAVRRELHRMLYYSQVWQHPEIANIVRHRYEHRGIGFANKNPELYEFELGSLDAHVREHL